MRPKIHSLFVLTLLFLSIRSTAAKLNNPGLAARIYEQRGQWWTSATDLGHALRFYLLESLQNAEDKGLPTSAFHISQLRQFETQQSNDPDLIREYELLFNDALLSYAADLSRSPLIELWLRYDELTGKYCTGEMPELADEIAGLRSLSDLRIFLAGREPHSAEYRLMLEAFAAARVQNNTVNRSKLKMSLGWYRWIHHFNFEKCIVVNIASAELRYYERNTEQLKMKVVVGKTSTTTPRFAAHCNEVILYPYWNVPRSIAVNEILPVLKRRPSYLHSLNLQVLDSKGRVVSPSSINWGAYSKSNFPYRFRQSTGCDNALGVIKFNLTSPFSVYMHDTNNKDAFERSRRYLSHGCIRLERPEELASWVITGNLDTGLLRSCVKNQRSETLKIAPVPVFVIYAPAEVQGDSLVYHDDVYNLL